MSKFEFLNWLIELLYTNGTWEITSPEKTMLKTAFYKMPIDFATQTLMSIVKQIQQTAYNESRVSFWIPVLLTYPDDHFSPIVETLEFRYTRRKL